MFVRTAEGEHVGLDGVVGQQRLHEGRVAAEEVAAAAHAHA
jgi:hypothetical protein